MYGGAVGGGKDYYLCANSFRLCTDFPGNRGFLGRKIGKHFNETTLVTWQKVIPKECYEINWQKSQIRIETGKEPSHIIFGGLNNRDEIDRFTSAEFGFVGINQAEELTEADYLSFASRMRWKLPDGSCPPYQIRLTANPRACYLRNRFILAPGPNQKFIQALPTDNPHLPNGYIADQYELYKYRPELIKAMLEGSWDIVEGAAVIIQYSWADKAQMRPVLGRPYLKQGVSIDPARFGDDETVIYGWRNEQIIAQDIFGNARGPEIASRGIKMCNEISGNFIICEEDGLGASACDSLVDILGNRQKEIEVIEMNMSSRADNDKKFGNKRAEAWFEAAEAFATYGVGIPRDNVLVGELTTPEYEFSRGKVFVQEKKIIKEKIGRSPDRADAVIIGLYGVKRAKDISESHKKTWETSTQKWVKNGNREEAGSFQDMEDI